MVVGDLVILEFSFENVSMVDLINMVFIFLLLFGFVVEGLLESDIVGNGSLINGMIMLIFNGGNLIFGIFEIFIVNVCVLVSVDDN